jgi:hypothetical protein
MPMAMPGRLCPWCMQSCFHGCSLSMSPRNRHSCPSPARPCRHWIRHWQGHRRHRHGLRHRLHRTGTASGPGLSAARSRAARTAVSAGTARGRRTRLATLASRAARTRIAAASPGGKRRVGSEIRAHAGVLSWHVGRLGSVCQALQIVRVDVQCWPHQVAPLLTGLVVVGAQLVRAKIEPLGKRAHIHVGVRAVRLCLLVRGREQGLAHPRAQRAYRARLAARATVPRYRVANVAGKPEGIGLHRAVLHVRRRYRLALVAGDALLGKDRRDVRA